MDEMQIKNCWNAKSSVSTSAVKAVHYSWFADGVTEPYVEFNDLQFNPNNEWYFIQETKSGKGFETDSRIFAIQALNATTMSYTIAYSDDGGNTWNFTGYKNATKVMNYYDNADTNTFAGGSNLTMNRDGVDNKTTAHRVYSLEQPLNDSFALQLTKKDADTNSTSAVGIGSLEGAVFEVDYWDNTTGSINGNPLKKWYFETVNKNGIARLAVNSSECFVETKEFINGTALKSSELYKNNNRIVYPLGTYRIKEVVPPKNYQLSGDMKFVNLDDTVSVTEGVKLVMDVNNKGVIKFTSSGQQISADNLAMEVLEKSYKGSIKLVKYGNDKKVLAGVTFKLVGDDGSTVVKTTDKNGEILFDDLIPQHYVLTETDTVDGYSLLTENLDVYIPLEETKEYVIKNKLDITKAIWDKSTQKYCFYDLTYTVNDGFNLDMPHTGGTSDFLYVLMAIAFALILVGGYTLVRRRHS
jgi:LPXTG-motif cell wall-anchored protein